MSEPEGSKKSETVRAERPKARPLAPADVTALAEALRDLVARGAPLPPGIEALAGQVRDGQLQRTAEALRHDLEAGVSLGEALGKQALPPAYAALLQAGEAAGDLRLGLDLVAERAAADQELLVAARMALLGPAATSAVAVVLLGAVLATIPPLFGEIFHSMGVELPLLTRLVVEPEGRAGLFTLLALMLGALLLLPGPLARLLSLGSRRDGATWGVLAAAVARGVPLPQALRVASAAGGGAGLASAAARLEQGQSLAASLEPEPDVPRAHVWLLGAAEERDCLAKVLADLAERDGRRHHALVRLCEALAGPAAILLVGGGVGVVVLALFLPIFTLQQTL